MCLSFWFPLCIVSWIWRLFGTLSVVLLLCHSFWPPSLCTTTNVPISLVLLSIEWLGNSGGLHSICTVQCRFSMPKSQAFCDVHCDKLCIYHQQELLSWSFELCMTCVLMSARLLVNTRWLNLQIQAFSFVYCALQSCVTDGIVTYCLCVSQCITGTWLAPTDPHSKLGRGMVTCWQSCTWNHGCVSNSGPLFCV